MQTDFENDGRAVCLPFRSAHDFRLSVSRKDTKKTALVVLRRAVFYEVLRNALYLSRLFQPFSTLFASVLGGVSALLVNLTDERLDSTTKPGNYQFYGYEKGVLSTYGAYGILKITKCDTYMLQELYIVKGSGASSQSSFIKRFGSITSEGIIWRSWYVSTAQRT